MLRWRRLIAWLGVAGLSLVLGLVWQRATFEAASWVAAVLALFVALAPEFRRFVTPEQTAGSVTEQLTQAADELAAAVMAQWDAEEKVRRLQDPWPLPVGWTNTTRPVIDHWETIRHSRGDSRPIELAGEVDQILEVFERTPSRRLVVLGPAGSGKSVLMLRLTLGLLGTRTSGQRVPVLLHLSTWNPGEQGLPEWLAAQLAHDYPALQRSVEGKTIARELVNNGRLLPVLDGLDEMPEDMRAKALLRINNSLGNGDPIAMTSRIAEYQAAVDAGDVLTATAVIELQPLSLDEVRRYLAVITPSRAINKWTNLFTELAARPDDPLHEVLSLPLMASLVRETYSDTSTDPTELMDRRRFPTMSALEDYLLDRLVPTVYRQDGGAPSAFAAESARRWLGFLAGQVERTGGDFAWWALYRMLPAPVWLLLVGLTSGILTGLAAGLEVGLLWDAKAGVLTGLAVFCGVGLASTASAAVRASNTWAAEPLKIQVQIRGRLWSRTTLIANIIFTGIGSAGIGIILGVIAVGLIHGWHAIDIDHLPWYVLVGGEIAAAPGAYLGYRAERRTVRQMRPMPVDSISVRITGGWKPVVGRIVGGLPAFVAVGIVGAVLDGDKWQTGLVSGAIAGVLAVLARPVLGPNRPARVRVSSWKRLATFLNNRFVAGMKLGFVLGVMGGCIALVIGDAVTAADVVSDLMGGGLVGFVLGGVLGLLTALGTGMADWSGVPATAVTPVALLRMDRRATITFVALFAMTAGLVFGTLIGVTAQNGVVDGLVIGAMSGVGVALLVAPGAVGDWAWYHWALAKIAFPLYGRRLPRRLLAFLQDAHQRSVLRQAGGVYQFRHARLLERLKAGPVR